MKAMVIGVMLVAIRFFLSASYVAAQVPQPETQPEIACVEGLDGSRSAVVRSRASRATISVTRHGIDLVTTRVRHNGRLLAKGALQKLQFEDDCGPFIGDQLPFNGSFPGSLPSVNMSFTHAFGRAVHNNPLLIDEIEGMWLNASAAAPLSDCIATPTRVEAEIIDCDTAADILCVESSLLTGLSCILGITCGRNLDQGNIACTNFRDHAEFCKAICGACRCSQPCP